MKSESSELVHACIRTLMWLSSWVILDYILLAIKTNLHTTWMGFSVKGDQMCVDI